MTWLLPAAGSFTCGPCLRCAEQPCCAAATDQLCNIAGHGSAERHCTQGMRHLHAPYPQQQLPGATQLGPPLQGLGLGLAPRSPQGGCPSGRRLRDLEPNLVIPALRRLWCAAADVPHACQAARVLWKCLCMRSCREMHLEHSNADK